MFWCKNPSKSISCGVMYLGFAAIFRKDNLEGSCDHPMGGGMLGNYQQNSDIVILCICSLSNIYN